MSLRKGARGFRQGVNSNSAPVVRGTQYFSGMPFPLNQRTNRFSIFASPIRLDAAYAVPLGLNIASNAGSPILIIVPERPTPRRNVRRDSLVLTGILTPSSQERLRGNNRHYKILEPKLRILKRLQGSLDHRLIGGRLGASHRVAE